MASHQSSRTDHSILVVEPSAEHHTGSQDVTTLISQPDFSNLNKPIIVQIRPVTASSNKLKSLLPKNSVNVIPISESTGSSFQVSAKSQLPSANKFSPFVPSEIIVSQTCDDKTNQGIVFSPPNTTGIIENILQHLQGNLVSTSTLESEVKMSHSCSGQDHDKTIPLTIEAAQIAMPEYVVTPQLSGAEVHPSGRQGLGVSASSAMQTTAEEVDKEQDVIKKTMVEAFVKMVVCRKVTVQKVHAKTGQILDTKVKMVCELNLFSQFILLSSSCTCTFTNSL